RASTSTLPALYSCHVVARCSIASRSSGSLALTAASPAWVRSPESHSRGPRSAARRRTDQRPSQVAPRVFRRERVTGSSRPSPARTTSRWHSRFTPVGRLGGGWDLRQIDRLSGQRVRAIAEELDAPVSHE